MAVEFAEDLSLCGIPLTQLSADGLKPPLISFVLICWNYEKYVGQAIRSIKHQDYAHFECLVVDNGSNDNSASVIQSEIRGDPRFSLKCFDQNNGQLGAAIWALDHIRGGFVVFVDADDVLFTNFASSHVQAHLALPKSVALTSSGVTEIDAEGKILTSRYSHINIDQKFIIRGLCPRSKIIRLPTVSDEHYELIASNIGTIPRDIAGWHWGPGTASMYRKSMLDLVRIGDGESVQMRSADTHFNYMCHAFAASAVIDLPLTAYRVHGANYFARQETLDPLSKGTKEYAEKSRLDRLSSAEIILKEAVKFRWLLGSSYWKIFDQCSGAGTEGRRRVFRLSETYEMFARNMGPLILAHDQRQLARELARRLGYRRASKLIAQELKRRLRVRETGQLLFAGVAGRMREIFRFTRSRK